jgi:tetratricopeptide (TPR) repeat protein
MPDLKDLNELIKELLTLHRQGCYTELENSCKKYIELFPDNLTILNFLAGSLKMQFKFIDSISYLKKMITIAPNNADLYYNVACIFQEMEKNIDARFYLEKAIKLRPNFANAYNNLANLSKKNGDFSASKKYYYNALKINPELTEAYYVLSSMIDFSKDDKLISPMLQLYDNKNLTNYNRAHICFALSKVYEDLNDSKSFFKYLNQANNLIASQNSFNIEKEKIALHNIKKLFSNITKQIKSTIKTKQPIFIVSMPRSGSTLVEQILSSHADVYGAGELKVLSKIICDISLTEQASLDTKILSYIGEKYIRDVSKINFKENIFTDKMPLNYYYIGFIINSIPNAKIIHVSREPIATCFSIYKHYFTDAGNYYSYRQEDIAKFYIEYQSLMAFWHHKFPNKIYELNYDSLTENQENETRKLLSYCGLKWNEDCINFHNNKRIANTASTFQVRKKIYKGSSDIWKKYRKYLQPMINILNAQDSSKKELLVRPALPIDF